MEGEDAFYDDHAGGCDGVEGSGDAGVSLEVVNGALDVQAVGQGADVLDEELGLEGVGVVEVEFVAGVEGKVGEIAVVEVEGEDGGSSWVASSAARVVLPEPEQPAMAMIRGLVVGEAHAC